MSNEETLSFIDDYKNFDVLWDVNNRDYLNNKVRLDKLKVLAKKYNTDISGVKNKIKSLRSYFSKEHSKTLKKNNGSDGNINYVSPWFAYKELLFIKDTVTSKETRDIVLKERRENELKETRESGANEQVS